MRVGIADHFGWAIAVTASADGAGGNNSRGQTRRRDYRSLMTSAVPDLEWVWRSKVTKKNG